MSYIAEDFEDVLFDHFIMNTKSSRRLILFGLDKDEIVFFSAGYLEKYSLIKHHVKYKKFRVSLYFVGFVIFIPDKRREVLVAAAL